MIFKHEIIILQRMKQVVTLPTITAPLVDVFPDQFACDHALRKSLRDKSTILGIPYIVKKLVITSQWVNA